MKPSDKDPKIAGFLEVSFGRTSAIRLNRCVSCRKSATEFRNEISQKEYTISGLCQNCQDSVFGKA